jgi:hypothetical protein
MAHTAMSDHAESEAAKIIRRARFDASFAQVKRDFTCAREDFESMLTRAERVLAEMRELERGNHER